ncbi:response regulator transcription factor [Thioalkalivibrio sp.]|uniref:response regulator transcription factor n=1 Tax=Thioalkalivibrio sp. TaxID=2093813 RepID=UPI003563F989
MKASPVVILLDDDPSMRRSLSLALALAGYAVQSYASAEELFESLDPAQPGCLLLDLKMPGLGGLEVQEELRARGYMLPVIFISAFADIPSTVRALKAGAVDFVEKPFSKDALVSRIEEAFALDRRQRDQNGWRTDIGGRAQQLTPREFDVMRLVTMGLSNKEIARELGISPRTVEKYRARVMEKMHAENIADLCRMAAILQEGAGMDQDSAGSA